jgi:hypothetical protein
VQHPQLAARLAMHTAATPAAARALSPLPSPQGLADLLGPRYAALLAAVCAALDVAAPGVLAHADRLELLLQLYTPLPAGPRYKRAAKGRAGSQQQAASAAAADAGSDGLAADVA